MIILTREAVAKNIIYIHTLIFLFLNIFVISDCHLFSIRIIKHDEF